MLSLSVFALPALNRQSTERRKPFNPTEPMDEQPSRTGFSELQLPSDLPEMDQATSTPPG